MPVKYRDALRAIDPYKPARSLESVKRELGLTEIIKLAGNENNHGVSPEAARAFAELRPSLTRYPDMNCTILREALTARLGVNGDELIFGNGSFELISLIAQTFLEPGDETVIPWPSFGWYKLASIAVGAVPVTVPLTSHTIDLDAVLSAVTDRTRVVWLCNPNNPTGTYFTLSQLRAFLDRLPGGTLAALDEAYIDFAHADDFPDGASLFREYDNVISLRTFSKVYGLASLRIGYAIAGTPVIDAINRARQPINVNAAAQAAAAGALSDDAYYARVVAANARGRELYYETLTRWSVPYIPTQGNFIMLDTGRDSAAAVLEFLKRGVMIRGGTEFGMPTWLRITIGSDAENRKVLDILRELLGLAWLGGIIQNEEY
ncbi:MAG: histidinol-phosphate transaminase [Oscillospiraceae bacterium]|jgi:histidinol-phosphate aminotransferase|nr:histidinol-phosphate transaminase [Oscillospiraceae bacterium]